MESLKDALRDAAGTDVQESQVKETSVDAGESSHTQDRVENDEPKHKSISTELRAQFKNTSKETQLSKAPEAKSPTSNQANTQDYEPIAAPADLKKEYLEDFNKLPPNLQKWLSQRSYEYRSDYGRQTQELRAQHERIRSYEEAIKPYEQEYARKGINPTDIIKRSIAWDNFFQQDPVSAATQFLASYGIDPTELTQTQSENVQQNQRYLTSEDAERIAEEKAQSMIEQRFELIEQERYIADASNVINRFIGSKPLFKDEGTAAQVEDAMAPVLQALRAADPQAPLEDLLETAYSVATTRNTRLAELTQRLNANTEAQRTKENALRAQQASRSITGSPSGGSPSIKPKTISEELRMRFNGAL